MSSLNSLRKNALIGNILNRNKEQHNVQIGAMPLKNNQELLPFGVIFLFFVLRNAFATRLNRDMRS